MVFLRCAVSNTFYNINKIAEELGERKCRAPPFFYALTGCDIVSSFFNQGKCKFWDRWTESQEEETLITVFMELSEKPNAVTEEQISVIEQFIGFVYYARCINSIDSEGMPNFEYSLRGNLWLIDTTVKIRVERAYKTGCVLWRLGQFQMCQKCLPPFPF